MCPAHKAPNRSGEIGTTCSAPARLNLAVDATNLCSVTLCPRPGLNFKSRFWHLSSQRAIATAKGQPIEDYQGYLFYSKWLKGERVDGARPAAVRAGCCARQPRHTVEH